LKNSKLTQFHVISNIELFRLIVKPLPKNIRHIDVSYNQLTEVPDWLNDCHQLRTLYANNNNISILPENLFQNENGMLHTIQLACNKLTKLPMMPKKLLPIQELYVNGNQIEDLPEFFFSACENLILLNVSNNKLVMLPILDGNRSHLERLYASNNNLHDRVLDTLMNLSSLRILHLSYNRLTAFPECCISNWPEIEELNISGNKIQHLPDNLSNCRNLRVLRAHSNQLQSTPILSKIQSLRVLDLAHNQLDKINLTVLVPKKLQFLDLSCNQQLQVDAKQLQSCRSQRPISLVDVSGKNRSSLPTSAPANSFDNVDIELPWKVGFSETTGNANKLYISQLRLPGFCNVEALFGMFDGESSNTLPNILVKAIPKILLEERTVKETSNDYMKYTLLSAHRELKQQGQKSGVTATLCHIARTKVPAENTYNAYQNNNNNSTRKFILRVATVGDCSAVLIRDKEYLKLTTGLTKTKIGCSSNYPMTVPDPECNEIVLSDHDEYLVLANKKLWEVMTPENVANEVRKEENVLLAAKRLQDIAQSYGAEENLSVMVVKFNNLGSDIDFLMRELRHTIKKKPNGSVISGFCKCGCCCENNSNCCHSNGQFNRQPSSRSDRSSPSGQSDQSISDNQSQVNKDKSKTLTKSITDDKKSLKTGIARAVRARIEEERESKSNESDSMMSEEQFKCWEYMLEQNTQLLFDKELNTISKAFTKRNQTNLNRKHVRSLSTSTPIIASQLGQFTNVLSSANSNSALNLRHAELPNNVFLSKHFGSARSFQQGSQNLFKPIRMNPAGASPRLMAAPMAGGPNAAYFGSLQRLNMGIDPQNFAQRLMPYNLEYDFGMIKERPLAEEVEAVNETDNSRMQHYWGVATTEL
jgi:PH domain and leucine-rich repeat-containing protein phosphatase